MNKSRLFSLYCPDMQETMMFLTYFNEHGDVEKVGIRYLSTREGQNSKKINHMEYSVQEAIMLVGTARNVWYDLTNEGWRELHERISI